MAERSIAAVLKTVDLTIRGFESLSLRLENRICDRWGGAGVDDRGRLLSGCRAFNPYPGFESLPPRLVYDVARFASTNPLC